MSSKYLSQTGTLQEQTELRVGDVYLSDIHVRGNYVSDAVPSETQTTSITTAVRLDNETGRITTVASTLAAGSSVSFPLNCTAIAVDDRIEASLRYNGSGSPMVDIRVNLAGAATVTLFNSHATDALDASLVITFRVYRINLA